MKYKLLTMLSVMLLVACSPKVDRSKAPVAAPAPPIQIGQAKQTQLPNGLKLIVVENHKLPRVSYSLSLDLDPVQEGPKAGYVNIAGELLQTGTTSKTKAQIDEAVDYLGATLSTNSNGAFGGCLKKHSEKFLEIMSDVILNPSFAEDEFQKNIKQTLSGLASQKTNPNAVSNNIISVANYGASHPYGEIVTESTVQAITRDDVVNYYEKNFKPNVAYLVVVGDITFEEAKAQAEKYFGNWKKGNVTPRDFAKPQSPAANRVVFSPIPGAVQSVISVTYPVDLKPGTQDAITASLMNSILGNGGFQARLIQNLREDKGYTYGAYSSITPDEVIGSFKAGASVRNEVTDSAIVQILYEMERMANELVPDSTLQTMKNIMTGNFARSLERPQTIANFALNIEKYNLPKDYYQTYLQKLNAITAADIQAIAKKYIKPANCNITVVGNKDIAPLLARFAASGKVETLNYDGTVLEAPKTSIEGLTAQDILKKYITAIGGESALNAVKSYEQKGTMQMGPISLTMNVQMKDNTKRMEKYAMGQMEIITVYDGTKGHSIQMGKKEPMKPDELLKQKMSCDMTGELHYEKYGITPLLTGVDMVNGEEAYIIELRKADGTIETDYFSVASGLRIKSISTEGEGEMAAPAETYYESYSEVGGIKYVKVATRKVGTMEMKLMYDEMILNPTLDDKTFTVE